MDADDERHGSNAGYKAHGRGADACPPCRAAHTAHNNLTVRLKAYGRYESPFVDAQPARDHVRALMDNGMAQRAIAKTLGVAASRIAYLMYGMGRPHPPTKIHRDFAEKILSVELHLTQLPILGARRRMEGLIALGYTQQQLSDLLGTPKSRIWIWLHSDDNQKILRSTHDRINAIYEDLSMRVPPAGYGPSRARGVAARMGYAPPLSWNNIDDPAELPDIPSGPQRTTWRRQDLLAEWDHLRASGTTIHQAATQLGVTVEAIERAQHREKTGAA